MNDINGSSDKHDSYSSYVPDMFSQEEDEDAPTKMFSNPNIDYIEGEVSWLPDFALADEEVEDEDELDLGDKES